MKGDDRAGSAATWDLSILPRPLAIVRLPCDADVPDWARLPADFCSLTRTGDELSIVIDERLVPPEQPALRGYRAMRVMGTLDPSLVGVLASISAPLAAAGVAIFVVSTSDTDYVLVREPDLDRAWKALEDAGHRVRREDT